MKIKLNWIEHEAQAYNSEGAKMAASAITATAPVREKINIYLIAE